MRLLSILFTSLLPLVCTANMASPVTPGSLGAPPFVSEFVDITHEDLSIRLDASFMRASVTATYHIYAHKDGRQIPLLFYASEYLEGFSVTIDGNPVAFSKDLGIYDDAQDGKFADFADLFASVATDGNYIEMKESEAGGILITPEDMRYFETDLTKGNHTIEVSYTATVWLEKTEWVTGYSFRYALSPAKYWKSFGSLSLTLDARAFATPISTNLPAPDQGSIDSVATWSFAALPAEIIMIKHTPKVNRAAKALIAIGPMWLAVLTSLIFILLHYQLIHWYRNRKPSARFSPVVIIGSIVVPLAFFILWVAFYPIIDAVIGPNASHYHGYIFLVIVFYPIVLPIYWLIAWRVDIAAKGRLANKETT